MILSNPITKVHSLSLLMLCFVLFPCCTSKKAELVWESSFYQIGSQSSPRATDLNNDGILDIILGAAQNEYQQLDQGIIAIDGSNGKILWQQSADDQVFGSATLYDITGDGVEDILIGGRSSMLKAIDGVNGKVIWEYKYQYQDHPILQYARFNFYSGVLVPDQNQNGYPELLTVNGGNVKALPYSTENRFPGVLMIFDTKTGEILASDTIPDSKESYMSPIAFVQPDSDEHMIVFGSGGETVSGNLYLARLADLMSTNLSAAKIIFSEQGHGFIAPPVVADISEDGYYDIVAISHGGKISAMDGKSQQILWETQVENAESSSGLAVGHFTRDHVPDFFASLSKGTWPSSTIGLQVMVDGKNGKIMFRDSLGCVGFWSPLAYDLNRDGIDEGIISYSEFNCYRDSTDRRPLNVVNKLVAIDFDKGVKYTIDSTSNFKNVLATPWAGDLDNDSYLDLVYSQCYSANYDILSFLGMKVKRISTTVKINEPIRWGGYMGSNGDGIYPLLNDK